jgi:hypothetical protein
MTVWSARQSMSDLPAASLWSAQHACGLLPRSLLQTHSHTLADVRERERLWLYFNVFEFRLKKVLYIASLKDPLLNFGQNGEFRLKKVLYIAYGEFRLISVKIDAL